MKKSLKWIAIISLALVTAACNNAAAPNNYDGNATPFGINDGLYNQDNVPNNYGDRYGVNNYPTNRYNNFNVRGIGDNVRGFDYDNIRGFGDNNMRGFNDNNSLYRENTGYGNNNAAGMNNQIGHARINANDVRRGMGVRNTNIYVDRDTLARLVSQVVASSPGVRTVTTAVTDEEIFVGLNTSNNNNQNNHNQNNKNIVRSAKMAAASVSPSYYKVYVTTDNQMFTRINRLGNLTTSNMNGQNNEIDRLIRDLGGATDGDKADKQRIGKTYIPDQQR